MATVFSIGQYVQLRIWTQMPSALQAGVNSCWYIVGAVGGSPSTDQDFATYMDSVIGPVYKPLLNNSADYRGCQVIIHSPVPPFPAQTIPVSSVAAAGAGTGGVIPMPKQTAALLKFKTMRPGPSGRGRIYIAFPPQAGDSGGGTVDPAYGALIVALGGVIGVGIALSAGGRTATMVRALVHGINKADIYPPASPVESYQAEAYWATQRRRGSFGRQNFSPI